MPYILEPMVAGELGPDTLLDRSTHPPGVNKVQYVLDTPTTADLIESFPVFLVSEGLAEQLTAAGLTGYRFDHADVIPSLEYAEAFGDAPHKRYRWLRPEPDARDPDVWISEDLRLAVSDRMWAVLQRADLRGCDFEALRPAAP